MSRRTSNTALSAVDAEALMQEEMDRETAERNKTDFDKKTKAAWSARAKADAVAYVNTEGVMRAQETARINIAVQRGREAANPNIAGNSDEKAGVLGLTPIGQYYLDTWCGELMTLHGVKAGGNKPPTIRTATSSFGAIMAAIQVGANAKLEIKNAEGKKELVIIPQDVGDFLLKSNAGKWQDTVATARAIRNAAGDKYQSSRGGGGGGSKNKLQTRTVNTILAKWKGKTAYDSIMLVFDFVAKEVREKTQSVNIKYFDGVTAEYRDSLSKCMLEVNSIKPVSDSVTAMGAPLQDVTEQRKVA